MLDNIVSLDEQRITNFQVACKDKTKVCMEISSNYVSHSSDRESSSRSIGNVWE